MKTFTDLTMLTRMFGFEGRSLLRILLIPAVVLSLNACTTQHTAHHDAFTIREEKYPGHYKVGVRYKVKHVHYVPKVVTQYEKAGMASWYGPGFYNNKTANGEIFTGQDLTAAHNTLPLPCVVKVTNLINHKSVLVRVNDRGPFCSKHERKRLIDLSEHAAHVLEMKDRGLAPVRVKLLVDETNELHEKLGLPGLPSSSQ